jgi:hypothetical protein
MKSALYPYVFFSPICYYTLRLHLLATRAEDATLYLLSSLDLATCVLNSPNIYVSTRGPKL